jgi:hypothetical protein
MHTYTLYVYIMYIHIHTDYGYIYICLIIIITIINIILGLVFKYKQKCDIGLFGFFCPVQHDEILDVINYIHRRCVCLCVLYIIWRGRKRVIA